MMKENIQTTINRVKIIIERNENNYIEPIAASFYLSDIKSIINELEYYLNNTNKEFTFDKEDRLARYKY